MFDVNPEPNIHKETLKELNLQELQLSCFVLVENERLSRARSVLETISAVLIISCGCEWAVMVLRLPGLWLHQGTSPNSGPLGQGLSRGGVVKGSTA